MHNKRIQVNHIKVLLTGVLAVTLMISAGCSNNSSPTVLPNGDEPEVTETIEVTKEPTVIPTETSIPTEKTEPTATSTPKATATPKATSTPKATATATPTATPTPTVTPTPFVSVEKIYEAEDAVLTGNVRIVTLKGSKQYSNEAYLDGFEAEGDSCEFKITIDTDGSYDLVFRNCGIGGAKVNTVYLDGEVIGDLKTEKETLSDSTLQKIYISAGEHSIKVSKSWGWIKLDYLKVATSEPVNPELYNVSKTLCNSNATENTKKLFSFLVDQYGKNILSGQVCDDGMLGGEMQVVKNTTGDYPAILSMDLMSYTSSRPDGGKDGKTIDYGIKWAEAGGILEYHWHWTVKEKYCTGNWYSSFYTQYTNFNLKKAMNGSDKEGYEMLIKDIDATAKQLKILADKDIPIIFRPLHEAAGGWFWWGASGADAYKELYILIYNKLTNEYGLNNIIWLWNGQDADWYPGDQYVDIVGMDIYPGERVYTSQVAKFIEVASWSTERKMVYLSECGCIFDPELAARDNAMWGCFCVWQGEFVKLPNFNKISEQYTEKSMMQKAYKDPRVLSLSDLPDLKNY